MKKTILIIDDFASVRLYHTSFLTRKGYQCTGCTSGAEALALLRREPFDLVLLDLLMPEMDGGTFLRQLDSLPALAGMPVLIVTSETPLAQKARAGINRPLLVLGKPVMPGELLHGVQQLLGELLPAAVP